MPEKQKPRLIKAGLVANYNLQSVYMRKVMLPIVLRILEQLY